MTEQKILRPVEKPKRGDAHNHPDYIFWCPGCECGHGVWTSTKNAVNASWKFNGDMEKPTFTPSILIEVQESGPDCPALRCHLHVTDGQLQFGPDCSHAFAGRTVDMIPF